MMKKSWMKPWLWIPAHWAHELSPYGLKISSLFQPLDIPEWKSFTWRGLHFNNPLGLAGGVDKNGLSVMDWWKHGAGFIEVGTVTPLPQKANPGKIIARDATKQAVWNRMGFPSQGGYEVLSNLKLLEERRTPLLINIGKNRQTPLNQSTEDYLSLMSLLHEYADIFVINISSPNTKDLRLLLTPQNFTNFLSPVVQYAKNLNNKPVLVKLSPDEDNLALQEMIQTAASVGIDGFVLTNTTTHRPQNISFPVEGGMSGLPLKNRSMECLQILVQTLGPQKKDFLIISAGGVSDSKDVFDRLDAGADLVEVYSTLIFNGPCFFREVAKDWYGRKN